MSHFMPKPRPPTYVGRETRGQAVDSSATVCVGGGFGDDEMAGVGEGGVAGRRERGGHRGAPPAEQGLLLVRGSRAKREAPPPPVPREPEGAPRVVEGGVETCSSLGKQPPA